MATRVVKREMAEPVEVAPAAQRLAIARDGLARLRADREAVRERKQAAQADMDELTEKLRTLQHEHDVLGADVGPALADVRAQCAEAARQVGLASAESVELGDRIAAVNRELPPLELAVLGDELAEAVHTGAGAADRYRAALEGFLAAALVLQSDLAKCTRLSNVITQKGGAPRTKLAVHLVDGAALDNVLRVARETGGDISQVRRVTAALFERWRI